MKKKSFFVSSRIDSILTHVVLITVCVIFAFPVFWLIMASFSKSGSIYDIEGFFPDTLSFSSYVTLLSYNLTSKKNKIELI